jgi:Icc-related predicted phosphoesterase
MKIDLISDTHNKHKEFTLKGGDLLIHSGDATGRGQSGEIHAFLQWFQKQPYKHKIFVPGNHDFGLEKETARYREECNKRNITLLIDERIEIEGIKIYGSPITPTFFDWAFMQDRGEKIKRHWDAIPDDTQILITHGPAYQIRDRVMNRYNPKGENVGCLDLRARIEQLKELKLHVFGHIHDEAGASKIGQYIAANASLLNDDYMKAFKPIRILVENGEYNVK